MKRCPQCGREYDSSMMFCLDDGTELLYGPAVDEPATAMLSNSGLAPAAMLNGERRTEVHHGAGGVPIGSGNSIAVLPFVDMSADAGNEYFCDGLAEELLNALSKIDELKVAARTSAFSFKGTNTDVTRIGQKLGVRTILSGGVRRSGDRMRVTVQLVNAADGYHLWSERYDRELKDIFDVQDEIALAVVDALKLKLFGSKKEAVLKRYTEHPEARELLLKGRFYGAKGFSHEWCTKAIGYFEQAIDIDPNYALAYSHLADVYRSLGHNALVDPKIAMPKADAALRRALELDYDLAEVQTELGFQRMYAWDWAGSESGYKRALELNPNLAVARVGYSFYLSRVGRHVRSLEEVKLAAELDPLKLVVLTNVGYSLYFGRRYDEAIEQYTKTLELDGNYAYALALLAYAYAAKGDYEQAIAAYQNWESVSGTSTSEQCYLSYALAKAGREEAEAIRRKIETTTEYVSPAELGLLYAGLGEIEPAFSALERAYSKHDPQLQFLGTEPHYDSLRGDPRFDDLLRRIGLPKQIL